MDIGIHSFAAMLPDEIVLVDPVGIGSFGVGEHHRPEYADASPAVVLASAAGCTCNREAIRRSSCGSACMS